MKINIFLSAFISLFLLSACNSKQKELIVSDIHVTDGFTIVSDSYVTNIFVSDNDWIGVKRAASDLADDIERVSGKITQVRTESRDVKGGIIVGTIGRSALIDELVSEKKIDVKDVEGQWESYLIEKVGDNLVIAGSDKRGTIYGIYEISQQIGVSPWYWWADAPAQHHDNLYVNSCRVVQPSPKVKYRGIFINDEWPSFGTWATTHFGDLNADMYCHMFELLLRLKANYLWPAMWDSRFNEDDPLNPEKADEYGIVMGTSHHEPMMRAHQEYLARKDTLGPWNYVTNKENIDSFFREGLERNCKYENLITIGMRGDGDVAMGDGDDLANMKTLTDVVANQRKIISEVYGRPAEEVPQMWAIFTEVQRYYDAGLRVPEDVTLLFCDNNWGYIRRIGKGDELTRKGGLGLYYHIDMNGGPWNDRWVNTTTLPKLREQLNLAYQTGIDRIWLINVGDLKPKELPIDFIMHYAWDPEAIKPGDEKIYLVNWVTSIFGKDNAEDIADVIAKYSKYNLWRKPEVQMPGIISPCNYNEAENNTTLWRELSAKAEALLNRIPDSQKDAFYQLVYYPAVASAGVAEMYNAASLNQYYASLGDTLANCYKRRAEELFLQDSLLTKRYNEELAEGKWNGIMQDKHIGYFAWFMPPQNRLPRMEMVNTGISGLGNTNNASPVEYSIYANHFTNNVKSKDNEWIILPDLGRHEACMGLKNVTSASDTLGKGPRLEYSVSVDSDTTLCVAVGILPTQDIYPQRGLRLGLRLDDGELKIIDARRGLVDTFSEYTPENLAVSKVLRPLPERSKLALSGFGLRQRMRSEVFDNIRWLDASFENVTKGQHTLHVVMIDPEIVVEQIVVNPDNNYPSYFGAPEKN